MRFDEFDCSLGIVDRRLDLASMTNDASIVQEPLNISVAIARDPLEIEAVEDLTETIPLSQNRQPRQATLKAFETNFLEQQMIVSGWTTPFVIVIREVIVMTRGPRTPHDTSGRIHVPNLLLHHRPNGLLQKRATAADTEHMERHLRLVPAGDDLNTEVATLPREETNVVDFETERIRRRYRFHPSAGRAWLDDLFDDDDLDPVC